MMRHVRSLVLVGIGIYTGLILFGYRPTAQALPEYATRTGEPCGACHVNPAGGGPRTVRGSLWVAAGRPDVVPQLPGAEASTTATKPADGAALYVQLGCAGCHGAAGEGGAGPALDRGELAADRAGQAIRNGVGSMMAFKPAALPDAGLAALVQYLQTLGRGEVKPLTAIRAMPANPAAAQCGARPGSPAAPGSCGGN